MATAKSTRGTNPDAIVVPELNVGRVQVNVVGITPFVCNAMSAKAKHNLLMPKGRKTAVEKAQSLKHNPVEEFVNSAYKWADDSHPTR